MTRQRAKMRGAARNRQAACAKRGPIVYNRFPDRTLFPRSIGGCGPPSQREEFQMAKGGKSKKKAETVFLVCEETGDYNYSVRRKPGGEKLKIKKYSPRLRRHTVHTEKKK
jgi:large subunit ribosomal protein L33